MREGGGGDALTNPTTISRPIFSAVISTSVAENQRGVMRREPDKVGLVEVLVPVFKHWSKLVLGKFLSR